MAKWNLKTDDMEMLVDNLDDGALDEINADLEELESDLSDFLGKPVVLTVTAGSRANRK